jgi:hypothetical protein
MAFQTCESVFEVKIRSRTEKPKIIEVLVRGVTCLSYFSVILDNLYKLYLSFIHHSLNHFFKLFFSHDHLFKLFSSKQCKDLTSFFHKNTNFLGSYTFFFYFYDHWTSRSWNKICYASTKPSYARALK